jgi:hypothetical protein
MLKVTGAKLLSHPLLWLLILIYKPMETFRGRGRHAAFFLGSLLLRSFLGFNSLHTFQQPFILCTALEISSVHRADFWRKLHDLPSLMSLLFSQQLSSVYQTVRMTHLAKLIPFGDFAYIEKVAVDAIKYSYVLAKIDHKLGRVRFGIQVLFVPVCCILMSLFSEERACIICFGGGGTTFGYMNSVGYRRGFIGGGWKIFHSASISPGRECNRP